MKPTVKTCALALALLIGGFAVLLTLFVPAANKAVEIRFLGFTNGNRLPELAMQPEPLALLAVTNRTNRPIVIMHAPPQRLRGGEWPKDLHGARAYLGRVAGHQESVFSLPAPRTKEPWRIPFVWGFEPTKLAAHFAVLTWRCRAAFAKQPLPGPDIVVHTNFSAVITSAP